ncbi:MAG: sulfur carrier protein ThiS [Gemmatimonadota bacterium]
MEHNIEIQVNGESRHVRGGLNVEELLRSLELQPRMIVVEHNGDILRRERYSDVRVAPGDALELVHFVGGG